MKPVRLCTVQFNRDQSTDYARLLAVFKTSIHENMPAAQIDEIILSPKSKNISENWVYTSNSLKLRAWVEYLEKTDDDVIFADCDMLCLGDGTVAFREYDFDVAITGRANPGLNQTPMNGGIVFVRPNDRSRAFFRAWLETNELLRNNPTLHAHYRRRWAGMNQAGYMMNKGYPDCKLITLPLQRWNATDSYWPRIDDNTVFVHIKSVLKNGVLKNVPPFGPFERAMDLWYSYAAKTNFYDLEPNL
jgi:hypothetical protein